MNVQIIWWVSLTINEQCDLFSCIYRDSYSSLKILIWAIKWKFVEIFPSNYRNFIFKSNLTLYISISFVSTGSFVAGLAPNSTDDATEAGKLQEIIDRKSEELETKTKEIEKLVSFLQFVIWLGNSLFIYFENLFFHFTKFFILVLMSLRCSNLFVFRKKIWQLNQSYLLSPPKRLLETWILMRTEKPWSWKRN